ncbi:pyridoxamine 5'-phosphate oxidase family protein [Burkholderia oklahomensis]|uniref:HugZ family pyridoxamine 5'-phosphate oxidase n=1 Tax=Burkholderia oklahomensis TaxID=342113 RepID=UPI002654DE39|nr:pyridoxamine 5'-phosphate oxidase family protein [Burkholderia oklahomensis]MDN7676137.1 pyridoxamine 5'-phosphate oxidase family protein [Burkholderia oklahomensis]
MNISAVLPLHLLHRNALGTLATQSRAPEGYPYPTVVPYAVDAQHRPVVLVSGLAEHTRNLAADPRAGFLVVDGLGNAAGASDNVLEAERATLVGRFEPVGTDEHVAARYLRYHPDGERYLALGDFAFWALACERLRYIGGFGRMGWLDATELDPLAPVGYDDERALWDEYDASRARRAGLELLGVDRYGADWRLNGSRRRTPFDAPKMDADALSAALREASAVSLT